MVFFITTFFSVIFSKWEKCLELLFYNLELFCFSTHFHKSEGILCRTVKMCALHKFMLLLYMPQFFIIFQKSSFFHPGKFIACIFCLLCLFHISDFHRSKKTGNHSTPLFFARPDWLFPSLYWKKLKGLLMPTLSKKDNFASCFETKCEVIWLQGSHHTEYWSNPAQKMK